MTAVSKQIEAAETRVKGLASKLALRQSQQGLSMSEGVAFGRNESFLEALRKELREAAGELIKLRLGPSGGWDALEILKRLGIAV